MKKRSFDKKRLTVTQRGNTNALSQKLADATIIVFDIETTGGNPENNAITEIMAIKIAAGKEIDRFYSLIDPKMRIPPIVRKMTGLSNQMLKGQPEIFDVMPRLLDFIGHDVLISHNTIGDMKFLRHYSELVTGKMLENYFLCTHLLTEKLLPEMPDKSLKGLARALFKHDDLEAHRAESVH